MVAILPSDEKVSALYTYNRGLFVQFFSRFLWNSHPFGLIMSMKFPESRKNQYYSTPLTVAITFVPRCRPRTDNVMELISPAP